MIETARLFGTSLDKDDFDAAKETLSSECRYIIGNEVLTGPDDICRSYEQNMIEGRKKLDKLEWGQSRIEAINASEFFVHFTDYLTHNGVDFTHRCKQRLVMNEQEKIILIEHIDDPAEQTRLAEFYKKAGLKS